MTSGLVAFMVCQVFLNVGLLFWCGGKIERLQGHNLPLAWLWVGVAFGVSLAPWLAWGFCK